MNTPTVESVATLSGRELDAAVHERVFGHMNVEYDCGMYYTWPNPGVIGRLNVRHYSTSPVALFALMEKVRENGWTSIDMHCSYIDGEAFWTVQIACGRGPCELHGNPHDNWHGVEAKGSTLPLTFARAALLTTITPKGG